MGELQAAEDHVAHELAGFRLAFEPHQLHQRRRDHLLARHVLARHRPIGHGVRLAVEIPLAGDVERVRRILDEVARVGFLVGGTRIQRQRGDVRRLVHLDDRHAYIGPGEHGDHLDIAAFPLLLDIAAAIAKLQRLVLRARAIDAVEAEVRRARALRPAPADEQLPELGTGGIGRPARPLLLLPARDHAAAADQRTRARRRLPRGVRNLPA